MKRNLTLDVAKGIGIILVILGHAFQYGTGLDTKGAMDLGLEKFIISFHMPLFMLISGYLFYGTFHRKNSKEIMRKNCRRFLVPICIMALLHCLQSHHSVNKIDQFLVALPETFISTLWFFWSILLITAIFCIYRIVFGKNDWGLIVVACLVIVLPDYYPLKIAVHLLPVFVTGYFLGKRNYFVKNVGGGKSAIFILCIIVYLFLYSVFGFDKMIYFSSLSIWVQQPMTDVLILDAYRFTLGIAGSLALLIALHKIKGWLPNLQMYLARVGRKTFELYVFQDFLLVILHPLFKLFDSSYVYFKGFISFFLIFLLSVVLTKFSEKYRYIRLIIGK